MHQQATSVAFKPSDLDTIVHAGSRRVRRRRAVETIGTLAAVTTLALAGGAVALLTRPDSGPPAGPWPSGAVSWSVGTTIHVGATDTIEVGHDVVAFVRTAVGFVALDDSDAVYAVTGDGVTRVGQMNDSRPNNTDQQRLVVNAAGTLVGWADESVSPGALTVRFYDPTSGTTRDFPGEDDAQVFAIDGRTAYWRTNAGVQAVDIDTGERRLLIDRNDLDIPDEIYSFEVYSAADGVLAFSPNSDGTVFVGRSIEDARQVYDFSQIRETSGLTDPVRLSPTGAWLSFGIYEAAPTGEPGAGTGRIAPAVFDTATGEQIALTIAGDPMYAIPSVWLNDTTLQLWAWDEGRQRATFHRCTMPAASCVAQAQVGPPLPEVAVPSPDGRWWGSNR
jgi:hypothetical protein